MFQIIESEIRGDCILNAQFTDSFERDLILKFVDELAKYGEKSPGNKLIVDVTGVTEVSIDYSDVKFIVQYWNEKGARRGNTAYVTGMDLGKYMIAKLFVDLSDGPEDIREKAFKDMDQALDWLCPQSPETSPPSDTAGIIK